MDDPTVSFEAVVEELTAQRLVLAYRLHNRRASRLYVFNALYRLTEEGVSAPDPELAYVHPGPADELTIEKVLVPIPRGVKVESPEVPYLDAVAPGDSLTGRIRVALPAATFLAYHARRTDEVIAHAARVRLRLGWIDAARIAPGQATPQPAEGHCPGHFSYVYGLGLLHQEIAEQILYVPDVTYLRPE